MQFTKAEEYGLFGMIHLANQPRGVVASLTEIAEEQDIPAKFLAKIFQNLTKAGLLQSHRGVQGGFSLARPPSRTSIADIVEAIQGDADPIKCFLHGEECVKKEFCPVRDLIQEGRKTMLAFYRRRTLKELADKYA